MMGYDRAIVTFSPDGRYLVHISGRFYEGKLVKTNVRKVIMEGYFEGARFSPNGKHLASGKGLIELGKNKVIMEGLTFDDILLIPKESDVILSKIDL